MKFKKGTPAFFIFLYCLFGRDSRVTNWDEAKFLGAINRCSALGKNHKFVLRHRFGLEGEKRKTLEEVGKLLGLTGPRIRQIEARALRILRHPVNARYFKIFVDQHPPDYEPIKFKKLPYKVGKP